MTVPNQEERAKHDKELLEKKRVASLVKEMNKDIKKAKSTTANLKANKYEKKALIRFPGL